MIDTLRLNLSSCEIKKSCPLTIQPGIIDYSTGIIHNDNDLFIDTTGKIIRGSKAFLNDDKFNLTIQPSIETELNDYNQNKIKVKRFHRIDENIQPDLYDWNSEDEVKGIFLQCSLPRLLSENNLSNLNFDDQIQALKFLESRLREFGIKTDIFKARLSRLDTFTNLKTDYNFYTYANLFNLFECSRMKAVGFQDESFLWRNKNRQLMIYDKALEQKRKNEKSSLKNIMRFENRLLKKRAIESSLKLVTVEDLLNNYDQVKKFHKKEIEKNIFKYTLDDINELTINNIKSDFKKAKKIFGKRWFDKYCENIGIFALQKCNSPEDIKEALIETEGSYETKNRMKYSRILKKINDSKVFFNIVFNETTAIKSNVDLYNELKTKFYKEVA